MSTSAALLHIHLKRAYQCPCRIDGLRVLVDALWPRGLGKQEAAVDIWLKEIAPSAALRRWYGHDVDRWSIFRERYRKELREKPVAVNQLVELCREGPVTLVFGARDQVHSNAAVLKEFLQEALERREGSDH